MHRDKGEHLAIGLCGCGHGTRPKGSFGVQPSTLTVGQELSFASDRFTDSSGGFPATAPACARG